MSQDTFNVVQSDTFANECIIAKKIYGRCKQQDCLKPLCGPMIPAPPISCPDICDGPGPEIPNPYSSIPISASKLAATNLTNATGQSSPFVATINKGDIINFTDSVSSLCVDNFDTEITANVCPQSFNSNGFYNVKVTYTFTYDLTLIDASGNPITVTVDDNETTDIPAYTTYTKNISLQGGIVEESTPIKVFDSLNSNISSSNNGNLCNAACNGSLPLNNNLPEVFVKAIANSLTANISRYFVPSPTPGVIPTTQLYRADVIIGLFTIIELYRLTTITVITTEPGEPPQCPPSYSNNDPCQEFNTLPFPYGDFNPPYSGC